MTSSKINTAPARSHSRRRVSRNPGAGGTQFMLPATGSTMTQAISPPICRNASRTCSASLKVRVTV
jgi:hypothetical protein